MKVSIITAVRNGRATVPDMLQSLRAQTHDDIEHVIQDGRSNDGTLAYLVSHGLPGMSLATMQDGGIYDAINRGIGRATGDVIGLLHADDRLAGPDVIAQVAAVLADARYDGVYGDLHYVARDDPTKVIRHWRAGPYAPSRLAYGWMPPHPTLYLRRRVFARAGLYDTNYRISGDYEAMLRYLTQGRVRLAYLPQVMVQMRIGGVSNRNLRQMIRKSREDYRAIRHHGVGGVGTLLAKNLSKLPQFLTRDQV